MSDEYILLLADVHANDSALRAAVQDARLRYQQYGQLKIWVLGDLFGRGPDPVPAWRRLVMYGPEAMVIGNQDRGVIGVEKNIWTPVGWDGLFRASAWEVILAHRRELVDVRLLALNGDQEPHSGALYEYLQALPFVCSPRPGIYLAHGGLERALEPQETIHDLLGRLLWGNVRDQQCAEYTIDALKWLIECENGNPKLSFFHLPASKPRLVLVGHYHRSLLYLRNAGGSQWVDPVEVDRTWELPTGQIALVSIASVGFPRGNCEREAHYAVLHLEDGGACSITFHKAEYKRSLVCERMREKGYPTEIVSSLCTYSEMAGATEEKNSAIEGGIL